MRFMDTSDIVGGGYPPVNSGTSCDDTNTGWLQSIPCSELLQYFHRLHPGQRMEYSNCTRDGAACRGVCYVFSPHILSPLNRGSNFKYPYRRFSALRKDLPTQTRFSRSSISSHSQYDPRSDLPMRNPGADRMDWLQTNLPRTHCRCTCPFRAFLVQKSRGTGALFMSLLRTSLSIPRLPAFSLNHRRLPFDYRHSYGI